MYHAPSTLKAEEEQISVPMHARLYFARFQLKQAASFTL
jgi:hypothetical protein